MKYLWMACGAMLGLTTLTIAMGSVPSKIAPANITDDTALYQNLGEIRVPKQRKIDFDAEIRRLSADESRFREKLPSLGENPRMRGPLQRISQQKYRYSGKKPVAVRN